MAEVATGLLTSALVGIAKDKLSSAIAGQANLLWNFGDDLEDMKDVLETISAALEDAERRSVKEKLVRLWLKRLKDTTLDISDILEDYQDTKKPGALSCLPTAYKKIVVAKRMKTMREKLSKINEKFKSFEFTNTQGTSSTIAQNYDKRETIAADLPEVIKGRDGHKQEIINLLSAGTNNDESEAVIVSIYALGGMGKSTLAQLVYKENQFKKYDHRIWVFVSPDFNLLKIGNSIISQLQIQRGLQNVDHQNSNLEVIQQCLDNLLHGKKVLIVLDDLWEQDDLELRKLKNMLHVGKKGFMIDVIVTTRKEEIAKKVSTGDSYNLLPLTDDICWEIIKISSMFEVKSNQTELEKIGLDIAKKCGGVPLAANALGYILRSKDLSDWKKINVNEIWNGTSEDRVLESLMLSYQQMPHSLKICFSYCAIFAKGHNIIEDDLIHQWSALDFIDPLKGKEYIKHLLGMSFLQFSKSPMTSKENVVRYTMHALVHDLARLIIDDELIVYDVAQKRNARANKYCHYSLVTKYDGTTKLSNILLSKMRVLRFSYNGEVDIPRRAFSFVKCLRTLDFSECSSILLPSSIGQLKQLRCLIAPRMQNGSLPQFITNLPKLQYLILNESSKISALPKSIGKLGCLEYLDLSGCSGISKLTESFGNHSKHPCSFDNLTNLQHLGLSRCSSLQEIPELFCDATQLQYLNLAYCGGLRRLPRAIGSFVDLKYLNMSWCGQIETLPVSMMELQNLLHLDFAGCRGVQEWLLMGGLRGLTTLRHLDLSFTTIPRKQSVHAVLGNLTNLKNLSLRYCDMFAVDFIGTLTNLEHLDLRGNFLLHALPKSIGKLKRLHTLDLTLCEKLDSLPDTIGALGLKSLLLEGCSDKVMDQGSSLVHYSRTLPVFKLLADDVSGCRRFQLLEDVNHISELRILGLQNARSLEEASQAKLVNKHNLSELTLAWTTREFRHLEDSDLLGQLVPPSGLKHLRLEGYSSTSFPDWLMDIRHLTNLVSVELSWLPKCSNLPPLGQLPHLEKLHLISLDSIKKIGMELFGGKGAFRGLSCFKIKDMLGLKEWNTTYSVEDGVEEFMFPVLDRLEIDNCPRLRLKPCLPTFRKCEIRASDHVVSSFEEAHKMGQHPCSSRCTNLELCDMDCQSMELFHHFSALQVLMISECDNLMSLPESMRHLTCLQSLKLSGCEGISALPEWLNDLYSLKTFVIVGCGGIKFLPSCIHQLKELEKIEVWGNQGLRKWWESKENKTKLAHINGQFHKCD